MLNVPAATTACRYVALLLLLPAAASSAATYSPSRKYRAPGLRAGSTSAMCTCNRRPIVGGAGGPPNGYRNAPVCAFTSERGPSCVWLPADGAAVVLLQPP